MQAGTFRHWSCNASATEDHVAGHSVALRYAVSPNYKEESEGQEPDYRPRARGELSPPVVSMIKNDWAVITLKDALNLKPIPVQPMKNASLPEAAEQEVALPGYGKDRPHLLGISRGYIAVTDYPELGDGYLTYSCEITPGGSGSPVLLLKDKDAAIIGIATAARSHTVGGWGVSATEFADAIFSANDGPSK